MTGPARPARAWARGFLPVLYTQRRGHCERGPPVRPPRRHRTPRPLLPVTLSWVFYLPDPTRRRPGWAGGRASPPGAPTGTPPPSWSDASSPPPPHGHHLCHYFPPRARPGRVPHLGSASPPPRGAGLRGESSFVAFYEESRTPPRSPPHPPRGSTPSPQPTGPRDHSGWTNPGPGRLGLSPFPASC